MHRHGAGNDSLAPYNQRQRVVRKGRNVRRDGRSSSGSSRRVNGGPTKSNLLTETQIVGAPPGAHSSPAVNSGSSSAGSMMLVLGTFLSAHIKVDASTKKNRALLSRTKWNITMTDVGLSHTTAGIEVHALSIGGQYSLRSFLPIKKLAEVVGALGKKQRKQQKNQDKEKSQNQEDDANAENNGTNADNGERETSSEDEKAQRELRKAIRRYRNADKRLSRYLVDAANSGSYETNLSMSLCRLISSSLRVTSTGSVSKVYFKFGGPSGNSEGGSKPKHTRRKARSAKVEEISTSKPTEKIDRADTEGVETVDDEEIEMEENAPEKREVQNSVSGEGDLEVPEDDLSVSEHTTASCQEGDGENDRGDVKTLPRSRSSQTLKKTSPPRDLKRRPQTTQEGRKEVMRLRPRGRGKSSLGSHAAAHRPRRSWRSVKTSSQLPSNPGRPRSRAAALAAEEDASNAEDTAEAKTKAALRQRMSTSRSEAEGISASEAAAAARLQAFARGKAQRREFSQKREAALKIQRQWATQLMRRLHRQNLDSAARARAWAGTVLTTVWRQHRKNKVSVVRRAVVSLQSRWRARQAMKHVSEHRAMYDMVLGPAVRKMQAAFRARVTRRKLRIHGIMKSRPSSGSSSRTSPVNGSIGVRRDHGQQQGPLSAGLLARLGSGHRFRTDFSDFDDGADGAGSDVETSEPKPLMEGTRGNTAQQATSSEKSIRENDDQRQQDPVVDSAVLVQPARESSATDENATNKQTNRDLPLGSNTENHDSEANGEISASNTATHPAADPETTADDLQQSAPHGIRGLRQVAAERRSNGREPSTQSPGMERALQHRPLTAVSTTSRGVQTSVELARVVEQENSRLMAANLALSHERDEAAKVLSAQKAMVKNILATAMRTNAAEVEELRAQIRNMELQASEAASLHETEVKHLQSAHRAETMSARVKINQLTGEVATLRESAGSSKHEIQGLLKKVNDLMEQNRALHQQNALEAAKVNAVKQEMLALDAQHRQYVKEAEERTMHSEVATERHFTADREQLLKSHARLVEALELQHRTKLSIIEGRLKSTQADRETAEAQWSAQAANFESIVTDLREQLRERDNELKLSQEKLATAREDGAREVEEKYLRQLEAERRGWTTQLKVAGEAAASHKDTLGSATLRLQRTEAELAELRAAHSALEIKEAAAQTEVQQLQGRLQGATKDLAGLNAKLSADKTRLEAELAQKEEALTAAQKGVQAAVQRDNDSGETIAMLGTEIEKLEAELLSVRQQQNHSDATDEKQVAAEEEARNKDAEVKRLQGELHAALEKVAAADQESDEARKSTAARESDMEKELNSARQSAAAADARAVDAEARASRAELAAREAATTAEETEIARAEGAAQLEALRRKLSETQQQLHVVQLSEEKAKKTIRELDAKNRHLATAKIASHGHEPQSQATQEAGPRVTEAATKTEQPNANGEASGNVEAEAVASNTEAGGKAQSTTPSNKTGSVIDKPQDNAATQSTPVDAAESAAQAAKAAAKAERLKKEKIQAKKAAMAAKRAARLEQERVARQKSEAEFRESEEAASGKLKRHADEKAAAAAAALAAEVARLEKVRQITEANEVSASDGNDK